MRNGPRYCEGDTILLAGATGRVGSATLTTLVREGARVVVLSRDEGRARAAIDEALAPGVRDRASTICADLREPADVERALAQTRERFGRVDAVVNLAGTGASGMSVAESTLDDLRQNLNGFVDTAYVLSAAAARSMLAQPYRDGAQSRGRIVTVTAGSSKAPAPGRALFGAAKAAVNTLMLGVARDHKADGIVANALVFLASDRSSGINGALVDLNAREVD